MHGKEDPDNRQDFPLGFPGPTPDPRAGSGTDGLNPTPGLMFNWTQSWIKLRRDEPALRSGRLVDLFYDDETYVFARQLGNETIVVAINRQDQPRNVTVPAASIGLKDGVTLRRLNGYAASSRVTNGEAILSLPARFAVAYKAS